MTSPRPATHCPRLDPCSAGTCRPCRRPTRPQPIPGDQACLTALLCRSAPRSFPGQRRGDGLQQAATDESADPQFRRTWPSDHLRSSNLRSAAASSGSIRNICTTVRPSRYALPDPFYAIAPTPVSNSCRARGAPQISWSGGCGAAGPPIEEVGPAAVVDAAFDGGPCANRQFCGLTC